MTAIAEPEASFVRSAWVNLPVQLMFVTLLALAVRLVVVAAVVPSVAANTFDHNEFGWEMGWVARSLALGQGFSSPFLPVTGPTALVPPLFPFLLSLVFRLFGIYTAHAAWVILGFNSVCSALTCLPVFFLTRNALNVRVARWTAFAWAVYPFAIYFSAARVWDYALTALLFTTCLVLFQKLHLRSTWAWVGFGALYGLNALSNPSIVSLLPFLLLMAVYKVWRVDGPWLKRGLLAGIAFFAVCTPWNLRNSHTMHSQFFLRDGFWIECYAGNSGDPSESNPGWAHPASNPVEMTRYKQLGEIGYIAEKRSLGESYILHHPGFVAVATVRRVVRFWTGYWSFSAQYLHYDPLDVPCVPFNLFLCILAFHGMRRWWRDDANTALPFLLAVVLFPLPYYLTHSSMDYRQPLEPVFLVLVVVGLMGTGEEPDEPSAALESEASEVIVQPV